MKTLLLSLLAPLLLITNLRAALNTAKIEAAALGCEVIKDSMTAGRVPPASPTRTEAS